MTPTHPTSRRPARPAWVLALAGTAAVAVALFLFWRPRSAPEVAAASAVLQPATVEEPSRREPRPARVGEAVDPARAQRPRMLRSLLSRLPEIAESDDRPPALPPEVERLLEQVAREEPRLALRIVTGSARNPLTRYALATVIARAWGATEPREAWDWASTNAAAWNLPEQRSLRAAVWDGMARSAPDMVIETATAVLTASPTGERGRENFALEAARALVAAGAGTTAQRAVAQWCGWISDDRILSGPIGMVSASVAATSPAAALQWLDTLAPSRARNDALAVVAAKWAETAPESAMAWAGGLPHGESRAAALQSAFSSWVCTDLVACVGWLAENEADPACDRLITNLVSNPRFRAENPRAAVELASAITDGAVRRGTLSSAIKAWAAQDERAARRYLSTTSRVSDTEKAEILQAVARRSPFEYN